MLQEMRVRNYSPRTITTYISLVAAMARHFGKSPDLISSAELKDYLFEKVAQDQLSPSAINQIISAFRILQVDVLGSDWDPVKIRRPKVPKTLLTSAYDFESLRYGRGTFPPLGVDCQTGWDLQFHPTI